VELLYKTQKRGQWLTTRETARRWLTQRFQFPADALGEFRTKDNTLSVYRLDADRANAPRILAAIGSRAQEIVHTDCLIFSDDLVSRIGINVQKTDGQTPDRVANQWHFDLSDLTATQLRNLAEDLVHHAVLESYLADDLIAALRDAASAGDVDKDAVNKKVRTQVGV
jgi:hypothetical protein